MNEMFHGLHFLRPEYLLWMVGAMVLALVFWFVKFQRDKQARKRYGEEHLVNRFTAPLWMFGQVTVLAMWLLAIGGLFTTIAGPVLPDAPTRVKAGSLQVVILSDVSWSMAAEDYRTNMPPKNGIPADAVPGPYGSRLDMAKLVINNEIMPAIVGNQMGIAVYMGEGFNVADLTDDYSYLRQTMKKLMRIGNAPGGGSDYAEGLKQAMLLFEATPESDKQKVVVMFTDGGFTGKEEALNDILQKLKEANVRLIIIGTGTEAPTPLPVYDPSGQQIGFRQKDGKTVTTQIDEAAINALVSKSGAEYIKLVPGQPLGIQWAAKLAGSKTEQHESDMYQYPLALTMFITFLLFMRGIATSFRRKKTG